MSLAESDIRGVDLSPGLTSTERIEIFLKNDIGRKLDYNVTESSSPPPSPPSPPNFPLSH